jgi:hypothetical protein
MSSTVEGAETGNLVVFEERAQTIMMHSSRYILTGSGERSRRRHIIEPFF